MAYAPVGNTPLPNIELTHIGPHSLTIGVLFCWRNLAVMLRKARGFLAQLHHIKSVQSTHEIRENFSNFPPRNRHDCAEVVPETAIRPRGTSVLISNRAEVQRMSAPLILYFRGAGVGTITCRDRFFSPLLLLNSVLLPSSHQDIVPSAHHDARQSQWPCSNIPSCHSRKGH